MGDGASGSESAARSGPTQRAGPRPLESWKEIAAYLGREVRTVQRWEKHEGLPVHRHRHRRGGTVSAFPSELDAWLTARTAAPSGEHNVGRGDIDRHGAGRWRRLSIAALVALVAGAAISQRENEAGAADTPALEDYRRAQHLLSLGTGRGYAESARYFAEAVARDPDFAPARVGLADARFRLGRHGYRKPGETMPGARAEIDRALLLDGDSAEAHAVSGSIFFYWQWDFAAAEREFRRALELDPDSARGHHGYAHFLSAMGRHEEALAASARARALEPYSVAFHADAAWFYYRARRMDDALEESRRALAIDPRASSALQCIVAIYARRGEYERALEELRQAARVTGDRERLQLLDSGPAGEPPDAALRRFDRWRLERLGESESYVPPFSFAAIHASLGELDEAFAWLERAYDVRDRSVLLLNVNPGFDPLRGDPRLGTLARRVGLPTATRDPAHAAP